MERDRSGEVENTRSIRHMKISESQTGNFGRMERALKLCSGPLVKIIILLSVYSVSLLNTLELKIFLEICN